jgi:hypothetical protein
MILGPVTIWAHVACYTIWREESCIVAGQQEQEQEQSPKVAP